MTSRSSFSNVLKEDRKRRIWPLVLFCLLCFLMTAAFELNLESYIGREWTFQKIQTNIERLTATGTISVYLIFAGIAACLYGFQGFGWLMKKEQVDFYHSQPMKREKRFGVIYLNGILMCLIPMMLHMAVYTILIGIRGYLNMVIVKNILCSGGIFLVAFLMMYHLVILSVMLSGNMIVSFLLCSILFVYPSLIRMLLQGYFQSYFQTYASGYSNAIEWIGYLSPAERVYRAGDWMIRGRIGELVITLLVLGVMAVGMLLAAFYLYKKRPSEAAGNALAYPVAGDLIRFFIVIPGGMFFGIMFDSLGTMAHVFWLYFGAIVGVVLAHGFLEVIFHFDIKAAIGKKVQMAAGAILVLCIVNVFCFDIFGYDTYIPKAEQVEELSYFINIGEYQSNYHMLSEKGVPVNADKTQEEILVTDSSYVYREEYQMKVSKTDQPEPMLELIRAYMKEQRESEKSNRSVQLIVHYHLTSGRDVYRSYLVSRDVIAKYYEPIYNTEEGHKVIYPYWNLSGEKVSEVCAYAPFMRDKMLELSPEEMKELAACYKKDIKEQSLTEMLTTQYLGEINFIYDIMLENNSTITLSFHVAKNHKNMLGFLEERDIYLTLPNRNYEITEVTVHNPYGMEMTPDHPFWKGREQVSLTGDQMEELIPSMIPDEYGYNGQPVDYFLSGYMVVKNKATGVQQQVYCNIPASMTPDYMKVEE